MKKSSITVLEIGFAVLLLCLTACSNPESDGKKVGEKYAECNKDYYCEQIDALKSFIDDFDPKDYSSRIEARKVLTDADSIATISFSKDIEKAEQYGRDKKHKYITNAEDTREFDYALTATVREADNDLAELSGQLMRLQAEAEDLIMTIIPPKPTEQKIATDLVGKTLLEPTHTLHRRQLNIQSADEVKSVSVVSVNKSGDLWVYDVKLSLNDGVNDYVAEDQITYELAEYDDWTIQYIESKYLDIVPTGKFSQCIVATRGECLGGYFYKFTNNCDVPLLVEGKGLGEYNGHSWEYVSSLVPAQSSSVVSYYLDFEIERVERP